MGGVRYCIAHAKWRTFLKPRNNPFACKNGIPQTMDYSTAIVQHIRSVRNIPYMTPFKRTALVMPYKPANTTMIRGFRVTKGGLELGNTGSQKTAAQKTRPFMAFRPGHTTQFRGFKAKKDGIETETVTKGGKKPQQSPKSGPQQKRSEAANNGQEGLWLFTLKTGLYTAGFIAFVFGGCAAWQYENARRHHEEFWRQGLDRQPLKKKGDTRNDLNHIWAQMSKVHKITYGIIGANCLVFAAWKFANLSIMTRWFTLSAGNTGHKYLTMLLSAFSHKSGIHLFVNMYVLTSFCVVWNQLSKVNYGQSQVNSPERYLGFYLSAGMCSSFLSLFIKTAGRIPQASLGASGAIMGLIGYTCEKLPHSLLSIIFLPNLTFTADSAKKAIIAFDAIGLLIGAVSKWRYMIFDHAGHLGGMLFGIWYAKYGENSLNRWSQFVIDIWRRKD